ncbi:YcaO-like family protein [Halobacterium litoreum]|uniref:YcaO-like family protein n=1 Tax=Halobacterium litoreum TaxID=2039234 RepID=A0ABD5NCN0_9EURY|nr:YcaO-like family protein [Halobacterium litoreum]UHH14200.1 YcaO-like family protein [Halobacterium litoreum]
MTVAVVGDGPAVEAVRAALGDADAAVESTDVAGVAGADLAVVVGVAGAGGFRAANDHAREGGTPLIAVEVGGLGGQPLAGVDAGVSVLAPEGPCFECLAHRVAATDQERAASPSAERSAVRLAGAHAGRFATDALAGDVVPGTVVELPHAERSLAPVPNCDCGDRPDRDVRRDAEPRSLDAALAAAEPLVDDRIGLLTAVGERESFPAPYYLAMTSDTSGFSDADAAAQAAGVDADWNAAYMKAVGEGLERYSAGVYRERDFESASADDENAVSPEAFVRPEGASASDALEWVRGEHLQTGGDALLPADRVVFPPPEGSTGPAITTGLGLGNSGTEALLSGLYETVERDATMLSWYSTFDPLGLAVDDDGFAELEKHAGAENLDVTALLCTQDVDVPVVAVAVHRDDWPRFALGSAADLDADAAARSALAEALQNWMELRAIGRDDAPEEDGAIGKYADFPREVRGFVDPDTTIAASDVGPDDPPEGAAELDAVLDALADAGLDAYAARLTPRDVERAGFEAVRVLVPDAQPLFVDQPFFGERAKEIPREMGFQPRLDKPFHPFP